MKRNLFLVSAIFLAVFMVGGARLLERFTLNREMLAASRRVVLSEQTDICPNLRISDSSDLERVLNGLEASGDARLHQLLGLYYLAMQDGRAALQTLEMGNGDTGVDTFRMGCAAYAQGDLTPAITAWRQANASQYFVNHGAKAGAAGKNADAIRFYDLATQVAPEDANAWLGLAQYQLNLAYAGKVSWQDTLYSAERGLALAPENLQAHFLVGSALLESRTNLARAEQELRFVYTRRGGWLEEYVLADALLHQGQADEATALAEKALLERDSPVVRLILTRAYFASGRCDLAKQAERDALAAYPELQGEIKNLCGGNSVCPCSP